MAGKKTTPVKTSEAPGGSSKTTDAAKPAAKADNQFVTEKGVRMAVLGMVVIIVIYFGFPFASDWVSDYFSDDSEVLIAEAPIETSPEPEVEIFEPTVFDVEPAESETQPTQELTEADPVLEPAEEVDLPAETESETLPQEPAGPAVDEARVASLEAELEALKQQLAEQPTRPDEETMSLASALAGLAPPLYQSRTFVGELEQIRILVLGMPALDQASLAEPLGVLSGYSRKGVPDSAIIKSAFKDAALQALREEGLTETSGWWARTWASIKGLVVIRRTDVADSATLEGSILKMESALAEGDVRGALDIMQSLNAQDAAAFDEWATLARGRVAALEAFEKLINFIPSYQGGAS